MKLASVTVAYHPDINELCRNLASYANDVDVLLLWDNSEAPSDLSELQVKFPQLVVHQDGVNHGLPKPYNWAIDYAKEQGCTHLMTMDQDSRFEDFHGYRQWAETANHTGISAIAINPTQPTSNEASWITCAGQSASIFPLDMLKEVGPFREDLFIGMVDAEICLRAQEKGYKILQYNGSGLIHTVGSRRMVKFLGHPVMVSDYNALRHYYDSRNRILLWHEFPYDFNFKGKVHHLLGRMKVALKILLFENKKWAKISAIVKGTYYGFRNRAVPYNKTVR